MYILSEILSVVAEWYTFHLFLMGCFEKQKRPLWIWAVVYGSFAAILLGLSFLKSASFLRLGYCAIAFAMTAKILFETKLMQAIYASVSFCCMYVLTDVFTIVVFSALNVDPATIMSYGIARAVCITVSHTVLLVLTIVVLALTKRKRSAITLPFMLALSPGCITGIVLGIYFCYSVQTTGEDIPLTFLISAIGLLYLNILIVFYAEQTQSSLQKQYAMELAEQHFVMQEQYYAQLREDQNETRAMFHDINKYLQAMRALAGESNTESARHVMEEAQTLFESLNTVVDVGNPIVSVILDEYSKKAVEHQITLTLDVSIPEFLNITAVDMYVIIGNTLDNALEACSQLPIHQRHINVQMRIFNDILFYKVDNPFLPDLLQHKKGKNHGYGLKNVQRCVEKYCGSMAIEKQNGIFIVSMHLNNRTLKSEKVHVEAV